MCIKIKYKWSVATRLFSNVIYDDHNKMHFTQLRLEKSFLKPITLRDTFTLRPAWASIRLSSIICSILLCCGNPWPESGQRLSDGEGPHVTVSSCFFPLPACDVKYPAGTAPPSAAEYYSTWVVLFLYTLKDMQVPDQSSMMPFHK